MKKRKQRRNEGHKDKRKNKEGKGRRKWGFIRVCTFEWVAGVKCQFIFGTVCTCQSSEAGSREWTIFTFDVWCADTSPQTRFHHLCFRLSVFPHSIIEPYLRRIDCTTTCMSGLNQHSTRPMSKILYEALSSMYRTDHEEPELSTPHPSS